MAYNNRTKGKVIERWFAKELRQLFPDVERNAGTQAREGGTDLIGTPRFSFEIKGGKAYKSKMVRDFIDQVTREGNDEFKVVLVKPDREEEYAIIPFNDFYKMLLEFVLPTSRRK